MDLQEDFKLHVETIQLWVRSCRLEVQLPICEEAVTNILISKFRGKVDDMDLEMEVTSLRKQIEEKLREVRYYSIDKPYLRQAISAY
jgi:hypothetical protein